MAKKISLIVLGDSNSTLKRYCISHRQLIAVTAGLVIAVAAVGYCLVQYVAYQSRLAQRHAIERQLTRQKASASLQRRQIQQFTDKLEGLKQQLLALNQLEMEIRTIANINPQGHLEEVFGVGGSIPEPFNTDPVLSGEHHRLLKEIDPQVEFIEDIHPDPPIAHKAVLQALEAEKNLLAHTPSIRPAQGRVASRFGYRQSPFSESMEFHKGIDIANPDGTPVMATADGMISFIGSNRIYGRMMVIDHGFGITTRYAHIDQNLKEPGDRVRRGDPIALMGNTGAGTGAHLHYEVRLHGVPVNPIPYISD